MIQRSYAELAGALERIDAMGLPPDVAKAAEERLQDLQHAAVAVQSGEPIGRLTEAKRRAIAHAATVSAPACAQLAHLYKDKAASFKKRLGR